MIKNYKLLDIILVSVSLTLFILLFGVFCPTEKILGLPCPGCGMSSALYHLFFKFDVSTALYFHPLVLVCVLYFLIIGLSFIKFHNFDNKIVKWATIIFAGLLLLVYIQRMITIFPDKPLSYNQDNLFSFLLNLFT
ncbi:MAG: DUF2752 domain-containing protein [Erysipelotrichaceae bacterium]